MNKNSRHEMDVADEKYLATSKACDKAVRLRDIAVYSEADGLMVVGMFCSECGDVYWESLVTAIDMAYEETYPLCIKCDPKADM